MQHVKTMVQWTVSCYLKSHSKTSFYRISSEDDGQWTRCFETESWNVFEYASSYHLNSTSPYLSFLAGIKTQYYISTLCIWINKSSTRHMWCTLQESRISLPCQRSSGVLPQRAHSHLTLGQTLVNWQRKTVEKKLRFDYNPLSIYHLNLHIHHFNHHLHRRRSCPPLRCRSWLRAAPQPCCHRRCSHQPIRTALREGPSDLQPLCASRPQPRRWASWGTWLPGRCRHPARHRSRLRRSPCSGRWAGRPADTWAPAVAGRSSPAPSSPRTGLKTWTEWLISWNSSVTGVCACTLGYIIFRSKFALWWHNVIAL